jgi:gliding motility-associated-like protein
MQIFSRWGELLFETDDTVAGWNGKFKEKEQQMDSYIWTISYFDVLANETMTKKGIILLLK